MNLESRDVYCRADNCMYMDFRKKLFKLTPVIVFILMCYSNSSAQMSRNEMMSYYKEFFLNRCMQPFEIDTGYRDEVCTQSIDWIDKRSILEVDSMSRLIGNEIRLDVEIINTDSSGDFLPSKGCVIHYCLDQYDSKDMDIMAKGFAKRMKKVKPFDYSKY